MKNCPHCGVRLEYDHGACPACHRDFSRSPDDRQAALADRTAAPQPKPQTGVAIARFENAAEAGFFAHALLNAEDIPATISVEENFDAVSGYWSARYLLVVSEEKSPDAAAALQSLIARSENEDFHDNDFHDEDFHDEGMTQNLLSVGAGVSASEHRFPQYAYDDDETDVRSMNWAPIVLTLAAGSLAFWGIREIQKPPPVNPVIPAGQRQRELWDELSTPSSPWIQQLDDGRRRELRFDFKKRRAFIREFQGNRQTDKDEFGIPAEPSPQR